MNDEPMYERWLLEAMEACRPGGDDLGDPQLADLAEALAADLELCERWRRLQQADVTLKAAFQDVPVPDGLAERLLARLAAARPEQPTDARAAAPMPAARARARVSRRAVLMAALTTAAVLLVAVALRFHHSRAAVPGSILEQATQFFAADSAGEGTWLAETTAPADYPFSRDVLRTAAVRWRWVSGFLGEWGLAYDLPGPGGARATLYVARRTLPGVSLLPPAVPAYTTAGYSAAAWQDGDMLYVLVVEGDCRTYQGCLDFSRAPLT